MFITEASFQHSFTEIKLRNRDHRAGKAFCPYRK